MKLLLRVFLSVLLALPIATSPVQQVAHGQQRYCDLALVLAMDASSSVNSREYELQLKGMASALLDFKVQEAIWTCIGKVPGLLLIHAAFLSKATGLLPARAECLRLGL